MKDLFQDLQDRGLISRRTIDVAVTFKGVAITGYVDIFDDRTEACMSTKSVFALREFFGGLAPNDEFFAACNAMHAAALEIIAAESE